MSLAFSLFEDRSRLKALLDHFSAIDDPRDARRFAHPLSEVLLLAVCGAMADCNDHDAIADWGTRTCRFCAAISPTISAPRADDR